MKILFMGTPEFAIHSLKNLYKEHDIVAIFTKTDKPNSRGKKTKFNPVKTFAIENNLPLYQPKSINNDLIIKEIKNLNPDLIAVVAYGKILPQVLIDIPKYGIINVHSSLLPKYRGAAPMQAAIINGDKKTGITIIDIVKELDAGDIILQKSIPIKITDTLQNIHDKLSILGSDTLIEAINQIEQETEERRPQDDTKATFVKTIKKADCQINWNNNMDTLYNFIRGLNPFPTSHSFLNNTFYKIYFVEKYSRIYNGQIGEVVDIIKGKGPVIKVLNGSLIITSIQPENRKKMTGSDLINGNYFTKGEIFSANNLLNNKNSSDKLQREK